MLIRSADPVADARSAHSSLDADAGDSDTRAHVGLHGALRREVGAWQQQRNRDAIQAKAPSSNQHRPGSSRDDDLDRGGDRGTGTTADGDPTGGPDSDPRTQCRDHAVTGQLPGPGDGNYPVADARSAHSSLDADAGDSDTRAHVGLHTGESAIYTGVHAPDRGAGGTHTVAGPGNVDRNLHPGSLTVGARETGW